MNLNALVYDPANIHRLDNHKHFDTYQYPLYANFNIWLSLRFSIVTLST